MGNLTSVSGNSLGSMTHYIIQLGAKLIAIQRFHTVAIFESLFLITDPLYDKLFNKKTLNVSGESAGRLLENSAPVKFVNLIYNIK